LQKSVYSRPVAAADPILTLVDHARRVRYEDLPSHVVETVKQAIIDTVGAGLAGSSAELGRIVAAMARENGGGIPAREAAFVHAIMARCRELDDVHEGSPRVGLFSIPFTVALALVKGAVMPDTLTEEALADAAVLDIARRIELQVTEAKNALAKSEGYVPTDVDMHMKHGGAWRGCEPFVKGHPRNPMDFDEVAEKFRRCAERHDISAAGSRSTRSYRWAKRAWAASVWRNGSAARRQRPDEH